MKPYRKFISELIGFSRRERRGTYILSLIVLVLIIIRAVAFRRGGDPPPDLWLSSQLEGLTSPGKPVNQRRTLFRFDPNLATEKELIAMGFTDRQAKTLINYRNSGAVFHSAEDLNKVYGIDSLLLTAIGRWVIFPVDGGSVAEEKVDRSERRTVYPVYAARRTAPEIVDLNRCSAADLEALPGIGPVLSERIIKYRNLLGGFADKSQLLEVYGLDTAVTEGIDSMVIVSAGDIIRIMLDTCGFVQMARHPYIGAETARAIISYRHLMGSRFTLDDLVAQRVLTAEKATLMAPYVSTSGSVPPGHE